MTAGAMVTIYIGLIVGWVWWEILRFIKGGEVMNINTERYKFVMVYRIIV